MKVRMSLAHNSSEAFDYIPKGWEALNDRSANAESHANIHVQNLDHGSLGHASNGFTQ